MVKTIEEIREKYNFEDSLSITDFRWKIIDLVEDTYNFLEEKLNESPIDEDEIMKIIYIWQDISKKVSGDKLTLIRMNLGVFFNKFINPEEETLSFFVSDNLMDFFHKFRRDLYSKIKDLNSFK